MKTLALLTGVIVATSLLQAQMTYDAAAEFSLTNNPAGVWSYGYSSALGGFRALPVRSGGVGEIASWLHGTTWPDSYPAVVKNLSGKVVADSGNVYQVNQLLFHPGIPVESQYAVVRFTAPRTGAYIVKMKCSGLYTVGEGTTTDVHALVNGTSMFDASVRGYAQDVSFASPFQLTLREGDVVDFVVGNGGNGANGDSTGLEASVTLVQQGVVVEVHPAVELGWNTEVGRKYQVQSAPTLFTNLWTNLGTPIPGDGSMKFIFDSTRGQSGTMFYRVLTVE